MDIKSYLEELSISQVISNLLSSKEAYKGLEAKYIKLKARYKANKERLKEQARDLDSHIIMIEELIQDKRELEARIIDLEEQVLFLGGSSAKEEALSYE